MVVHAYFICWNEEKILPYLLRHYREFCDKIVIYDNYSDDRSIEIIENEPKAEYIRYKSGNQIRDDIYLEIKNNCWRDSIGIADYVIVGDADEFLWHKNMLEFLTEKKREGYTIFKPTGYDMMATEYPTGDGQIYDEVVRGFKDDFIAGKQLMFDPNALEDINYNYGCHECNPRGEVKRWVDTNNELRMLHMKSLGLEFLLERHKIFFARLSKFNINHNYGVYAPERDFRINDFQQMLDKSEVVMEQSKFKNALDQLNQAPLSDLMNFDKVANMIADFGLVYDPDMENGLFGKYFESQNQQGDPGLCQYPEQLAAFLIECSNYKIDSYCEIGLLNGYSIAVIATYLRRFNPNMKAFGVDINGHFDPEVIKYIKFEFIKGTSEAVNIKGRKFDLVFIDGDHSYEWAQKDWENSGQHAGLCGFHDIHPSKKYVSETDTPLLWKKLIAKNTNFREYLHYTHGNNLNMGIGLIMNGQPKRRNILIAAVGRNAMLRNWNNNFRSYDIHLICYHKDAEILFKNEAEKVTATTGLKYHLLKDYIESNNLNQYEYFFFPDDDIFMQSDDINKLFRYMRAYDLDLAQPSLLHKNISHEITKNEADTELRFTGFVEVMIPAFSQKALNLCLPTFKANRSSWGYDLLWHKLLGSPTNKFAIIDGIAAYHTKKSELHNEFYTTVGSDPYVELQELMQKHSLDWSGVVEYSRVST